MDQASGVADRAGTDAAADRGAGAVAAARAKSQARTRFNRGMKVLRRAHLYAGLFMVPWVFLYGISAVLFNHPDLFADAPSVPFTAEAARTTALGSIPRADALAGRVVESLNRKAGPGKAAPYRLVEPDEAAFARDLTATVRGDGKEYNVRLDLADGSGTIRPVEKPGARPAPFAGKGAVKLDAPAFEPATRGFPELLGKLGYSAKDATVRAVPDLTFLMGGPGAEVWRVTYNAGTNQLAGRPAQGAGPSLRRELLSLHLAHGFPARVNARWAWAVFVDLMFVSMVGWGATGLAMWWQMKNVRRIGAVVLVASLIVATLIAIGMHATFVAEGLT